MKILIQLKNIKQRKLERAQQALQIAVVSIAREKFKVETAKKKLVSYVKWRAKKEDEIYEEAYQALLTAKGVDDLRLSVGRLRAKDAELNRHILNAENQLELAVEYKKQCQKVVSTAQKVLEKYNVLLIDMEKQKRKQIEKEEESVLDEYVISRFSSAR